MRRKVVVENTLSNVRTYLGEKGYDVRTMYNNNTLNHITSDEYDAIVISNMDGTNLQEDTKTNSPIISAAGLTPEEVYERINGRLT